MNRSADKEESIPINNSSSIGSGLSTITIPVVRTPALRPFSAPKVELPTTQQVPPPLLKPVPTINNNNSNNNNNKPPTTDPKQNTWGKENDPVVITAHRESNNDDVDRNRPDLFQEMKFVVTTTSTDSTNNDNSKKVPKKEVAGRERHRLRRSCSNLSQLVVEDGGVVVEEKTKNSSNNRNNNSNPKQEEKEDSSSASMIKDLTTSSKELKSAYLMRPCPQSYGIVRCYVKRCRSAENSFLPVYSVFLKEDDVLLMSSKKKPYKTSSNYTIRMDQYGDILGKLRSNMFSSEYTVYDSRIHRSVEQGRGENNVRAELGAVIYQKLQNNSSTIPPRKMQVCINPVETNVETPPTYTPKTQPEEMLKLLKYKFDTASRNFSILESKTPQWDEKLESFVLNFGGRVTMDSEKNFQLVQSSNNKDANKEQVVLLQFGRVAKDEFTMDFQWPLSPFLAFALSLSSCDSKVGHD